MAYRIALDPGQGVAYVRVTGTLDAEAAADLLAGMTERAGEVRGLDEILDLSGCAGIQLGAEDISRLASGASARRTTSDVGRLGVLAPHDLAFGIARMYEAVAEGVIPAREMRVARALPELLEWLGLPEGWTPPE